MKKKKLQIFSFFLRIPPPSYNRQDFTTVPLLSFDGQSQPLPPHQRLDETRISRKYNIRHSTIRTFTNMGCSPMWTFTYMRCSPIHIGENPYVWTFHMGEHPFLVNVPYCWMSHIGECLYGWTSHMGQRPICVKSRMGERSIEVNTLYGWTSHMGEFPYEWTSHMGECPYEWMSIWVNVFYWTSYGWVSYGLVSYWQMFFWWVSVIPNRDHNTTCFYYCNMVLSQLFRASFLVCGGSVINGAYPV